MTIRRQTLTGEMSPAPSATSVVILKVTVCEVSYSSDRTTDRRQVRLPVGQTTRCPVETTGAGGVRRPTGPHRRRARPPRPTTQVSRTSVTTSFASGVVDGSLTWISRQVTSSPTRVPGLSLLTTVPLTTGQHVSRTRTHLKFKFSREVSSRSNSRYLLNIGCVKSKELLYN